jgi:hypothetical protein
MSKPKCDVYLSGLRFFERGSPSDPDRLVILSLSTPALSLASRRTSTLAKEHLWLGADMLCQGCGRLP